ncbi:tetratricopeptide repeat protein [Streptomyces sp. ISL-43]|uniref:ATP-binding protein n=1 Tax=Streptomyces sp. ISL-43 TaxID=2819183 RepID=UPI001BE70A67|nr:tetratricopeptide repeat protein [Streptomyces sp. ISL-43]MBT2450818.1 tetratricopeptide repeat protein [Streptomyces sp. ISL-43]
MTGVSGHGNRTGDAAGGQGVQINHGSGNTQNTTIYNTASPSLVPAMHQLPRALADFTGRTAPLNELEQFFGRGHGHGHGIEDAPPILLVYGMGGVGKTTLAVHLAHRIKSAFPDAQLMVALGGSDIATTTSNAALDHLMRSLGLDPSRAPQDFDGKVALYRSLLVDRRALIVLDDASRAEQVEPLLPASAACAAIITSRSALPGLDGVERYPLPVLLEDEGIGLLARLVGDRVHRDLDASRRVVDLCAGLPLALRIAGASMTTPARVQLPISSLLQQLKGEDRRLDRLTDGRRAVRATFAASHRALSPEASRVFGLLGLLRIPVLCLGMIAELSGGGRDEVESSLAELVDAQLLQVVGDRYKLHDLVRLLAVECSEGVETDERSVSLRRAFDWYLGQTRTMGARLYPGRADLCEEAGGWAQARFADLEGEATGWESPVRLATRWFEAEQQSLVAVVKQCYASGLDETCWRLTESLVPFFELQSLWSEWRETHSIAFMAVARSGDSRAEARSLRNLALLEHVQGHWDKAISAFERCILIFRGSNDVHETAVTLARLGKTHRDRGGWDSALNSYDVALPILREYGDRWWEASVLSGMGDIAMDRSRWKEGARCANLALSIFRELGDRRSEGFALVSLGIMNRYRGLPGEAISCFESGISILRDAGDKWWEMTANVSLGMAYCQQGRLDHAHRVFDDCLGFFEALHASWWQALTILGIGDVHLGRGQWDDAMSCFDESLPIFERFGDQWWVAVTMVSAGRCHMGAERPQEAIDVLAGSVDIFDRIDAEWWRAVSLCELSKVHAAQGSTRLAVSHLREAVGIFRDYEDHLREEAGEQSLASLLRAADD